MKVVLWASMISLAETGCEGARFFAGYWGALAVAGVADFGIYGLQLNPNAQYRSVDFDDAGTRDERKRKVFFPDYLDFLEWMKSVSDKVP